MAKIQISLVFKENSPLCVYVSVEGEKREEGVRAQRGCPFRGLRPSKPLSDFPFFLLFAFCFH